MKRSLLAMVGFSLIAILATANAWGIPSFARKYGTSCQTCHIAYPKLNNFGNTFRLLGYRMPGETEDQVKQEDVRLGAPAYKRVWPKAVWPGAIPMNIPVALSTRFLVDNSSRVHVEEGGEEHREIVHNDFLFPSEIALIAGGSAGDHIAYFGEISFEQGVEHGGVETDVSVGHMDLRFIQPFGNAGFNAKIGSFQPEFVANFDHARRLTVANYASMFGVQVIHPGGGKAVGGEGHHGAAGGVALPAIVRGFETFGILGSRFLWSLGGVNGLGPGEDTFDANSGKDAYASLAYKWGGLALDGSNAETYVGSSKNWREHSFRLGVFAYFGDGEDIFNEVMEGDVVEAIVEAEDFTRFGIDFNWFFKDVNIFGAYVKGEDDLNVFDPLGFDEDDPGSPDPDESGTFDYDAWFVEVDAVLGYPWLHGALRYETVSLPHVEDGEKVEDYERVTASLTGLARANVKMFAEYSWDLNESRNYNLWLGAGLAF